VKSQASESPILRNCPIHVVANPIDTAVFKPGDRKLARERLKIPESAAVIMIAANHLDSQFKGARDAVCALESLGVQDAFVLLVGRSSEECAKQISLPNLSLGYVEDSAKMAECYHASDVFMIPSRVETFGLVAAEAVACGAAVVSYKAGGLQEVTTMANGIVVDDGDISALRNATRHLLLNAEDRTNRVATGQPNVMRTCSPNRHAQGCMRVYESAIRDFGPN
jgi:glycosyltransferase involved in cell wall biosynthesis